MLTIRRFLTDEAGTTAIEYCLIGVLVSIVIVAGATLMGADLSNVLLGPVAAALP